MNSAKRILVVLCLALVSIWPASSQGAVTWDWSFSTEVGTFITNGDPGDTLGQDTFTITSIEVISSAIEDNIGASYLGSGFSGTDGFVWDGSKPTQFFRESGTYTNGSNFVATPYFAYQYSFQPYNVSSYLEDTYAENEVASGLLVLTPRDVPPVADADGPYDGFVDSPVDLDGSGSYDPDDDPLTYSWSVSASTPCTFDDDTSSTPQLTCSEAGIFTVTLTVIDDGDASDSDTATVTIIIPNTPPVAEADGPYSGIVGSPVNLDGSGSDDPDDDPLTYSWSVSASTPCTFDDDTLSTPQLTCTAAGPFIVTLTVIDDGNASGSDTADVTINTPQEAIASLIGKIESLVDDGELKPGQANGLIRPLQNAIRSLNKGNDKDACNQLDDFIDKVYAKTPSPLDAAKAAELITDANAIRAAIGCP